MSDFSLERLRELLKGKIGPTAYSDQIDRALHLAFDGHHGQFREQADKNARDIPYIVHPIGAALLANELLPLVDLSDNFDDVISACLTHDLLEDTPLTASQLEQATSKRTASIVLALTKPQVSKNLSREKRNAQFVQQIMNFGRTAMFIKLCDFLHNISRPKQTPLTLLKKAIRRGKVDYMRFFDDGYFSSELRAKFIQRLSDAELYSVHSSIPENATKDLSFQEAVEIVIKRSEFKVLELHDIADILQETISAKECFIISIDDYIQHILVPRMEGSSRGTINQIHARLSAGALDISSFGGMTKGNQFSDVSAIYSYSLALGATHAGSDTIIIALSRADFPAWASRNVVKALVSLLSERLRILANLRISELSDELSHIGIDVNPGLVLRLGLSYEQLVSLKTRLDAATFVHSNLQAVMNIFYKRHRDTCNIDRFELRVKSPASILGKMRGSRYKAIDEIDDLVGIRIVCLGARDVEMCTKRFIEMISAASEGDARAIAIKDIAFSQDVSSAAGYAANHVRFSVSAPFGALSDIKCELQVRTIFQDAWARASHLVQYKSENKGRQRDQARFLELSKVRDSADEIINKLS